jgi:hypothetical protein
MMSILRTTMLSSKGKLCSRKDEVISKLESLKKRLEGMTGTSALRTDARQEAVDAAKQVYPWAIACSSRKFDYKNLFDYKNPFLRKDCTQNFASCVLGRLGSTRRGSTPSSSAHSTRLPSSLGLSALK